METRYFPEHGVEGLLSYPAIQQQQARLRPERILLVLICVLAIALRVTNLDYNTLFVDEAIYATLGHEVLQSNFSQDAPAWMFGSYLYPYLVGIADSIGGVIGIRALSVALGLLAVICVYLTTRRVFGEAAALAATLLFGLSGPAISLGQQAVIDALGMPLLALSLYLMVVAAQTPHRERVYLTAAGIVFCLSVLAKYISLLLLPALFGVWVVLHLLQGRNLFGLFFRFKWAWFVFPLLVIFSIYGAVYFPELRLVFKAENATQLSSRVDIVQTIVQEVGLVMFLGMVGLGWFLSRAYAAMRPAAGSRWRRLRFKLQFALVATTFTGAVLGMQLYHLVTANIRSLWKHDVYTLLFLAPLAGYAVSRVFRYVQTRSGVRAREQRLLAVTVLFTSLLFFVNNAQDMNWSFQYSWPNVQRVVNYLKTQDLTRNSYVMAAGSTVYEYYLKFRGEGRTLWFSTWFMEYQGTFGEEAIRGAIRDCALEMVILDDYYTPEWTPVLTPLLEEAGYQMVFSDLQVLSFGAPVGTRVFEPGDWGQCQERETRNG